MGKQKANMTNTIFLLLRQLGITLIRCKNNHKAFYSKVCPFCGEIGRRPFRYNLKLKVGKSFCCGVSFKDVSWFNTIISNRDKYEVLRIQHDLLIRDEYKQFFIDKYFEDKKSMKQSVFEKSDLEDLSIPF
jgi:hypothetical protein